ncbi:MAG TPA: hypothetical protein VFH56_13875 [Acidimicrobiales bacterium]|nr:hypothetical protein [Acidimicrobiales bacterium]
MTEQNIPVLPWELSLKNAAWFIDDRDGVKVLKLVPLAVTPQGMVPTGMAVEVQFDGPAWEKFSSDVAAGEKHLSKVIVPEPGTNGHLN